MNLFSLEGSYFVVDNAKVFDELVQYVIGALCESIVKPFGNKNGSCIAVLALQRYANGDSTQEWCAADIYSIIDSTVHKQMIKRFSLDDSFARLRELLLSILILHSLKRRRESGKIPLIRLRAQV